MSESIGPSSTLSSHAYVRLLQEVTDEYKEFLDGLFASFFKSWRGGYTVLLPNGERFFERESEFEPFCAFVKDTLKKRKLCLECDRRRAIAVANERKPTDYWCDWGLRDLAVPIVVHNVSVGTILCGQKRLDGPEDQGGVETLNRFVVEQHLEEHEKELHRLRGECRAVDRNEIQRMKRVMWATSQYLTRLIYTRLDEDPVENVRMTIQSVFQKLSSVGQSSSVHNFWDNLAGSPLREFRELLGAVCVALWMGGDSACSCVAVTPPDCRPLFSEDIRPGLVPLAAPSAAFGETVHGGISAEDPPFASCPITSVAKRRFPKMDEIIAVKAKIDPERYLLIYAFFDSESDSENLLYLHQKQNLVSRFITETINFVVSHEKVEELRQNLKERDRFIKDVVHLINQPLHSIVAYADNFLSPDFSDERRAKIPRLLHQRARQVSVLIKCLEVDARGTKDIFARETVSPKPVEISRFLIDCAIDMQGYAEEENVKIGVQTESTDRLDMAFLDDRLLRFGVTNVLFNGVKYSFPNTTIYISGCVTKTNDLLIRFTSRGIGIPRDMWEKIFLRGVRTSQAVNFSQSGLGIGLYVTREAVHRMGGKIIVEESRPTDREPYKGFAEHENVFTISLPYTPVEQEKTR